MKQETKFQESKFRFDDDNDDDSDFEPISYFDAPDYDIDSTSETEIDLRRQGYINFTSGLKGSEVEFLMRKMDRRKHTPVA